MALDRETIKDTERLKQEIRKTQTRAYTSTEVDEKNVESLYGIGKKDKTKNDLFKLVRGMGNIDKKDKINNSVVVSSKGLSKSSGIITDDDEINDNTFTVEQSRNDREREYHEKSMSNIRHSMQAQSKAMLTGMNNMNQASMRLQSKYWKAQIAVSQNMVNAITKANEFRYTVQANYYKNSIDYKKNILTELQSINKTLRVGFNINNKGEVQEDRMMQSMARVMLGEDWKKGLKGGLVKSLEQLTGGGFGMLGMMKELFTSGIDQLNRGGLFKNLASMGVKKVGGKFLGQGRANQIATLISDPGAFLEALADRLKHSNNEVARAFGKGFGSNKEKFGTYSGVESHKNQNMKDRASFDKAAHTALTRIIPMHLSNIEAKLHNREAVYFDYSRNQFMSKSESKKELQKIKKSNMKDYEKNVDARSKILIETMMEKSKGGAVKKVLSSLSEDVRNNIISLISKFFQSLAYAGENISEVYFDLQKSPGMLTHYIPQLKVNSFDDKKIKEQKKRDLFLIMQILNLASSNFNEELVDLIQYAKDLKESIEKSIKETANAVEGSTATFADMAGYYAKSGKGYNSAKGRKRIDIYDKRQEAEFSKYAVSYEEEKLRVKKALEELKIGVKREQIYELMVDMYENQTASGRLIAAKAVVKGLDDIIDGMKEKGVDFGPQYDLFVQKRAEAEALVNRLRSKEKEITDKDLDDWADKGYKTNRFGGAKIPTNAKEIKENAEIFLNSELGDKVSKTVQFGSVAALSALIAKKGGMGKYGAPIAGAIVASAVHASGKLNKMVRVIGTEEGDELMEDGRTRREALMHNLIKDMLPAGFAVATGVKVSNFIKNSINFGGILGPVIGFGVGSAIFTISKLGWVKKLAKGLFGGVGKILGFVDKKLFKGFFSDITGGVKTMFMEGIGKKLGLDRKSVSYKDILDKNGTKPVKGKKEKVEKDNGANDEDVSGNASARSIIGSKAGVCAPMIMSRIVARFQNKKVSDRAFEDDALEYLNKNKDGITMNFFYERLADTGLFRLTRIQQPSLDNWEELFKRKNTVVIGHKKMKPAVSLVDARGFSMPVHRTVGTSNKTDDGHFLLYSDYSGDTVSEFDPLTKKYKRLSLSAAWLRCGVILGVTFVGDRSKIIEFDVPNDGKEKKTVKGASNSVKFGSSFNSPLGNPNGKNGKGNWSSMGINPETILNVNIVGGHLDAVGVLGGMDAQSYKTKVTDMIRRPISKSKISSKQLNNTKEFYNRDKYGRFIKDEQNRQEEREKANSEALQTIAGKDGKEKPEEKKKSLLDKILGLFPFLLGLFPFIKNMRDGIFKIVGKGLSLLGKGIWKGVKGLFGLGKKAADFGKKGWEKLKGLFGKGGKEAGEEVLEEGVEKAGKEAAEEVAEDVVKVSAKEVGEEVIEETAEKVAKEGVEEAAESGAKGLLSKTLSKITPHLEKLVGKLRSLPVIGKLVDKALASKFGTFMKGALGKVAKEAVEEGVESGVKGGVKATVKSVSSGAAGFTFGLSELVVVGFGVWDVIQSVKNTHKTFGVEPKDVKQGMRICSGVITGILSALEMIPFASWVLLPVRVLFEKKLIVMAYNALYANKEKEEKELELQIRMDTNGDGEVSEKERADFMERARKRREVDERNGNKYADMVIKKLTAMVKGVTKIPFLGKLIKEIEDKDVAKKAADVIGKKVREGIVKQFVHEGTPMMRKQINNKRVNNFLFGGVKTLFSPFAAGASAVKEVQRTAEIMGANENTPVTIFMQLAVGITYYFLGLASADPSIGFIMAPLKDYGGDELCRFVYKEVMIPIEDALSKVKEAMVKYGVQLVDANGDGKLDEEDIKVIKERVKKKAEELQKKLEAITKPLLEKGRDIVNSIKNMHLVKGVLDYIKKNFKVDINKFTDEALKQISDFIGKMAKDIPPAVIQEMDRKLSWADKAVNSIDKGLKFLGIKGAIDLGTSIWKALNNSHEVFDIQPEEVDQCHQLVVLIVDIGLQHLINMSPLASNIGKVVRDAYLPKICIPLYNKWFGEMPGGVKFEDYTNDMKDPRVTKAKLEEAKAKKKKEDDKKRKEMSEDQKAMQKNENERFKSMANSLFGDGGLNGGFIDSEGNSVAMMAQPQQAQGGGDGGSSGSSDSSSSSDSSGGSSSSGGSNLKLGKISDFDQKLVKQFYKSEPTDDEWRNWRRFILVHPNQWAQAMGWLGTERTRESGKQKLSEWANFINMEKSSTTKANAKPTTSKNPTPTGKAAVTSAIKKSGSVNLMRSISGNKLQTGNSIFKPVVGGKGSRIALGGRGSNVGGRIPFYSQDSFLSQLNIGSENGSEAGCALAVAKMIVEFRGIKMNDMELYSTAKKYILPDNSIEPSFFTSLGGSLMSNVTSVKSTMSSPTAAGAFLVNKGGYNHYVAIINDNGRLMMGDPEMDGWQPISLDHPYMNSFYAVGLFEPEGEEPGYDEIAEKVFGQGGKGRGRIGGKGPGDSNNSGPKRIGFGQGGEVGGKTIGSSSTGGFADSRGERKASYTGSLYSYKPGQIRAGSGGAATPSTSTSSSFNEPIPMPHGKVVAIENAVQGQSNTVKYEDGTVAKRSGTIGFRMFNPDSHDAGSEWAVKKFGGLTHPANRQVTYPSPGAADAAMKYLISPRDSEYPKRRDWNNMTIRQFISTYAPPKENPTEKYIKNIVSRVGKPDSTVIKDFSPAETDKFLWGIRFNEIGADTPEKLKKFYEGGGNNKEEIITQGSGKASSSTDTKKDEKKGGKGRGRRNPNLKKGIVDSEVEGNSIDDETAERARRSIEKQFGKNSEAFDAQGDSAYQSLLPILKKYYHPDFIKCVEAVFTQLSGKVNVHKSTGTMRTKAKQAELYAQGRTKPGKIVTRTMETKHRVQSDGYVHAIDIIGNKNGQPTWDPPYFTNELAKKISSILTTEAAKYGLTISSGVNWPSFSDPPHHEWYAKGQSKENLTASDKEDVDHSSETAGAPKNTGETANANTGTGGGGAGGLSQDPGKLVLKNGAMGGWYNENGETVDLESAIAKAIDRRTGNLGNGGGAVTTGGGDVSGAPWMEIAKREIGVSQAGNSSRVLEYCKAGGSNSIVFWCAAFITWCLKQANVDISGGLSSQFPTMSPGDKEFEKLDKPRYGAIAVLRRAGGKISNGTTAAVGHITFFVKDDGDGKFTGLGGNQGHREVKESHYTFTQGGGFKFVGFYWPKKMKGGTATTPGDKTNSAQGKAHYDAGGESELLEGFYKSDYSYPEAVAALDRKSSKADDNKYLLADIDSQNLNNQYNSIFGGSNSPSVSSSHNQALNMVNNSNLKASPLNKGGITGTVGFAGGSSNYLNQDNSVYGVLVKNNKLMEQMLKENRALRGLTEQSLDMQTWTALSNEEIAKKKFNSDITNVYTGEDSSKLDQFSELSATLNKWKGEKIDINYEAEFAAEESARLAKVETKTNTARAVKAKRSASARRGSSARSKRR